MLPTTHSSPTRKPRLPTAILPRRSFPTLTPLAFDPGRPFPHISNLSLNLAILIRDLQGVEHFARVKVPDSLPQLVPLQSAAKESKPKSKSSKPAKPQYFVWLEQLIVSNLHSLFPGMEVLEAHPFHVTRDADTAIQQLEAGDLLESVEEGVAKRRFADVVRLEINDAMPAEVLDILLKNLEVEPGDVYKVKGPLALSRLKHLLAIDRPDLKDKPFVPSLAPGLQPPDEGKGKTFFRPFAGRTFFCTTRSTPSSLWLASCNRRRAIPRCWPSRSRFIALAATLPWSKRCWTRLTMESRSPFLSN